MTSKILLKVNKTVLASFLSLDFCLVFYNQAHDTSEYIKEHVTVKDNSNNNVNHILNSKIKHVITVVLIIAEFRTSRQVYMSQGKLSNSLFDFVKCKS